MTTVDIDLGAYQLGWHDEEDYVYKPEKGLDEELIRTLSGMKGEPVEYGTHVPLLARWPGTVRAGSVDDKCVARALREHKVSSERARTAAPPNGKQAHTYTHTHTHTHWGRCTHLECGPRACGQVPA